MQHLPTMLNSLKLMGVSVHRGMVGPKKLAWQKAGLELATGAGATSSGAAKSAVIRWMVFTIGEHAQCETCCLILSQLQGSITWMAASHWAQQVHRLSITGDVIEDQIWAGRARA